MPRLVQSLHEDDFDRRLQFCEELLMSFENDPGLIDKTIWNDEAIFQPHGQVTVIIVLITLWKILTSFKPKSSPALVSDSLGWNLFVGNRRSIPLPQDRDWRSISGHA